MQIRMLQEATVALSRTASLTYPAGWEGDIAPDVGRALVAAGKAEDITPVPAPAAFTATQVETLRSAADEIQSLQRAAAEADVADLDFKDLKVSELREIAEAAGIDGFEKMKKADLVAALEELRRLADAAAADA